MDGVKVETCSVCGNDFWAGPKDGGVCFSCSYQTQREAKMERRKQAERERREARVRERTEPTKVEVKPKIMITPLPKSAKELEREELARIYKANQLFGYVYLLESENGFYKIGISKDIVRRKWQIDREYPIRIELVHQFACNDRRKVEKCLHEKYAAKRVQYEWFKLDPEDVQWISSQRDHYLD